MASSVTAHSYVHIPTSNFLLQSQLNFHLEKPKIVRIQRILTKHEMDEMLSSFKFRENPVLAKCSRVLHACSHCACADH